MAFGDGALSPWLLSIVSAIYAIAALDAILEENWGLAMFFMGCVIANAGIVITAQGS